MTHERGVVVDRPARARGISPVALAAALCALATLAQAQDFDRAHTRIGFDLRTRWGHTLQGVFPRYDGEVRVLADGRHQVRMTLQAAAVEIVGHDNYTAFSRGRAFFDAERYPHVTFVSDPYPPALLQRGGVLHGVLAMHGVSQREAFKVQPARCTRPARDCDLLVSGSVRREDYGMDRWRAAVQGRVQFNLVVRLRDDGASS